MHHCGIARRIRHRAPSFARSDVRRTAGRKPTSAPCSVSGGVAGFSCDARTAPWAYPSAQSRKRERVRPPFPLQRCQHGSHQRQVCRPIGQMPVHARDQLRLGVFAEGVQFLNQRSHLRVQRIHRRQLRNFGAGRLWRGAGRLHRIRRPRFVMRQQCGQHDERQCVVVLIAVEHVANERAFGLVHAGGKQGVGRKTRPIRQRDRLPDASACSGASPR